MYALSYWLGAAIVSGVGGQDAYSSADLRQHWEDLLKVIVKLEPTTMITQAITSGALIGGS